MSIRATARRWFQTHIGVSNNKVFSSKFYTADHAWPKKNSWWFEIPLERLEANPAVDFHLLCQESPGSADFHYLKVPAQYFLDHLEQLTIQKSGSVSIFPSAEEGTLFRDLRAKAQIHFRNFLIET